MFGYEEELMNQIDELKKQVEQWKELATDMYWWIDGYLDTSGQYNRNGATYIRNRYEQLEK